MEKLDKNYFRNELIALIEELSGQAVMVTAKYKHTEQHRWATFTTVRRHIQGTKTKTICNHVNLERREIETYYHLTELDHNRQFYITGYPSTYDHYGDIRGNIRLSVETGYPPIRRAEQSSGSIQDAIRRASR